MKHVQPFFLIDPTLDSNDQERLAYAQDVFISRTILGYRLVICDGPIESRERKCAFCHAPTGDTPHPYKEDLLPFSSSFDVLPDLMRDILYHWPLRDLRLLSDILRPDDPCVVAQDIIHVYQKRHPLAMTSADRMRRLGGLDWVEYDSIQCLAQDVYFIPRRNSGLMSEKYSATLLIGRVVARLQLSPEAVRLGTEDSDEQWVSFPAEQVPLVLTEHPEWDIAWHSAWKAYIQEMKKQEREDEDEK